MSTYFRPAPAEHAPLPATVERVAETVLPTRYGVFRMLGYRDTDGSEHVALVRGGLAASAVPPLVRVHSECLTGDALGSYRCDCGEQLDAALRQVSEEGHGVVVYVRGHEGRGIGLLEKLRAYALQDQGADTVDANTALGFPADARSYHQTAEILQDLGLAAIRLLSSNPAKQEALEELGITVVERRSLIMAERAENAGYLATKRARMRHDPAPAADVWRELLAGVVPHAVAAGEAEELVHQYGPLVEHGTPMVLGQLGQSMDGFIASRSGDAEFVTGSQDREHLHRLRALMDAVVVGAGTVVADDCRLTVRAVPGSNPVRVVLDPSARVPLESAVLSDGAAPTLWVVGAAARLPEVLPVHVEVQRLEADGGFDPRSILGLLSRRSLCKVLVEGGGRTVSRFLQAGVLDRLYLTTAPILVGDGVPGIRFDGTDALSGALSAPVRRFVFGRDVCTEFNFSAQRRASLDGAG
jgi:GTP cyclohydrolase II